MQTNRRQQPGTRILYLVGLVVGLLALAACQPIRDPAVIAAEATAQASGTPAATEEATSEDAAEEAAPEEGEASATSAVAPATATISADSLRVRAEPSDTAEVVAGARGGESYPVIGISSDGAWIQLEIDRSPSGTGWVSASYVTLEGDITNIVIVEVEASEAITTEVGTEEATAEATTEAGEEAATEEATAEPTAEATEEPVEEATPEATEAVTETATTEATEEPTEEATEEPAEEATPEATEEATAEATEEATAAEEADTETDAATSDTELGTVTIVTDLPLRVRSAPTADEENKVGNVFDGEVYTVLEISDDGEWVRIDVPELAEDGGWVSAEYVVFNDNDAG